jgi:hypothetical protein
MCDRIGDMDAPHVWMFLQMVLSLLLTMIVG